MSQWQPCVYMLADEKAPFRFWALVACTDGVATRYSREGQYKDFSTAATAARDMAKIYNANGMTPKIDGTTFTAGKLPNGGFAYAERLASFYAGQDRRVSDFLSAIDAIAGTGKPGGFTRK